MTPRVARGAVLVAMALATVLGLDGCVALSATPPPTPTPSYSSYQCIDWGNGTPSSCGPTPGASN